MPSSNAPVRPWWPSHEHSNQAVIPAQGRHPGLRSGAGIHFSVLARRREDHAGSRLRGDDLKERSGCAGHAGTPGQTSMNMQQKFFWLFGGILALLIAASLLGFLLHRQAARRGGSETIANFNARVRAWWIMVAIIAVNFFLGRTATIVLFAVASLFALREFITLTPTRPGDHLPLVFCFYVLLPVQYWLIGDDWYNLFAIFLPVYG